MAKSKALTGSAVKGLTLAAEKHFSGSPGGRIRVLIFFVISKVSTIVDIGTAPDLLSVVVDFCRYWPSAQTSTLVDCGRERVNPFTADPVQVF